ncbi:MAG TPA: hypothetical protein DCR04_07230 [Flavobacteriales bacterium]|nr:hypothetical protein [Flavobacteriales bacterium]
MIKTVLFDAANTLIHKPESWDIWLSLLSSNGFEIDEKELKKVHKIVSETIRFPDRPDKEFYNLFNSKVLFGLGILPSDKLVSELYQAIKKCEWRAFDDVSDLLKVEGVFSVASNFNSSLRETLSQLLPISFNQVVVSEEIGCRKPTRDFYEQVVSRLGVKPSEVLYVGDSLELDVWPALKVGMNAFLIDRDGCYPRYENRLDSFSSLNQVIGSLNED